jgi:hypothetical protein
MTTSITLSPDFQDLSSLRKFAWRFDRSERNRFLNRMARLDAERDNRPIASAPGPGDLDLAIQRRALDQAWAVEVHALILVRRTRTAEALATAKAAREATARIVRRIEATPASTAEGVKAKARAALWRRNGEPANLEKSPGVSVFG